MNIGCFDWGRRHQLWFFGTDSILTLGGFRGSGFLVGSPPPWLQVDDARSCGSLGLVSADVDVTNVPGVADTGLEGLEGQGAGGGSPCPSSGSFLKFSRSHGFISSSSSLIQQQLSCFGRATFSANPSLTFFSSRSE